MGDDVTRARKKAKLEVRNEGLQQTAVDGKNLLPKGEAVHSGLKTSFIASGRMLKSLASDGFNGYLRLRTGEGRGVLFWRDGVGVECWYEDGEARLHGQEALTRYQSGLGDKDGWLDLVILKGEVIDGLIGTEEKWGELYTDWVKWEGLLEFLKARGWTGKVGLENAVVVLSKGEVVGAWQGEDELGDALRGLGDEMGQRIEVKEAGTPEELDLSGLQDEVWVGEAKAVQEPVANGEPKIEELLAAIPEVSSEESAPPEVLPSKEGWWDRPLAEEEKPEREAVAKPAVSEIAPVEPLMPTFESVTPEGETTPPAEVAGSEEPPAVAVAPEPVVPKIVDLTAEEWKVVMDELAAMAEEEFGNRARKVKDVLRGAHLNRAGVNAAIDEAAKVSLLFVDQGRLVRLAQAMRDHVEQAYAEKQIQNAPA